MDDTDRKLLSILRADARTSVVTLAKKLCVARATVQNRIAKLEASGTIMGYTVQINTEIEAHQIRALTFIEVEGNHEEAIRRELRGYPNVVSLHTTNGRWDFIAEVRADTLESFDQVLNAIRKVRGITNTETSILLSAHKN